MAKTVLQRRIMRLLDEATYVNTINVTDQVGIEFVWYPGESGAPAIDSLVDTLVAAPGTDGAERKIEYTWARTGKVPVKRTMTSGRINIPLPPGATGVLTVFGTGWQITRAAVGAVLDPVATVQGMQERLNQLGYQLRVPGQKSNGVDGVAGRKTENAVLAFQTDYRPIAGAPAAAANRLSVRGEWALNPAIAANLNWYNQVGGGHPNVNPSGTDSAALQAALVAAAGA
jgi:hypothetical protein